MKNKKAFQSRMSEIAARADPDGLRKVFNKYSDVESESSNERFMSGSTFYKKFIGLNVEEGADRETLGYLTGIVDTSKDGKISFDEFVALEGLLTQPDAIYRVAFRLFDLTGSGLVSFEEFRKVYSKTSAHSRIPFNYDCDFVKLHFGKERKKELSYFEFTQFLQEVQEEQAKQAFSSRDAEKNGFILPLDFKEIMTLIRTHLLTPFVANNLVAITKGDRVSYSTFDAVNVLLSNADVYRKIFDEVLAAKKASRVLEISKEDFLSAAQSFPHVTPLEIELLFQFAGLSRNPGFISAEDFDLITPRESAVNAIEMGDIAAKATEKRSVFMAAAESAYRFALGSIAGAVGATAVYPIDLVKTRMQNQRTSLVGEVMYKHSFDCFTKVVKFEGVRGLYRGLLPQLMGVAPEKAIKLTVNDLVRDICATPDGGISLWAEILAGGCAGASQVVFTNPLEIVKIRLQVSGEIASTKGVSAIAVIRELGLFGLYKGARACFLRDIPFSAIYFPMYAHLKKSMADENGKNSPGTLFVAGVGAGIPAPFLTTPADVIKTRLQVKARSGQTTYNGVVDCARKVFAEEGFSAFWKGSLARVFRSAPQFGVTLFTYELLQRTLAVDFGGRPLSGATSKGKLPLVARDLPPINPDHIGGLRSAVATFAGVESKFGLFLPKFSNPLHNKLLDKP